MIKAGLPKLLSTNTLSSVSHRSMGVGLVTLRSNSLFHTSSISKSKMPYIDVTNKLDKNGIETSELIKQRKQRPLSPHLTIYQPQLTWYMSSFHRLSLIFLGLGFYAITLLFGLSGLVGLNLTSDKIINWYHDKVSRMNKCVTLSI